MCFVHAAALPPPHPPRSNVVSESMYCVTVGDTDSRVCCGGMLSERFEGHVHHSEPITCATALVWPPHEQCCCGSLVACGRTSVTACKYCRLPFNALMLTYMPCCPATAVLPSCLAPCRVMLPCAASCVCSCKPQSLHQPPLAPRTALALHLAPALLLALVSKLSVQLLVHLGPVNRAHIASWMLAPLVMLLHPVPAVHKSCKLL